MQQLYKKGKEQTDEPALLADRSMIMPDAKHQRRITRTLKTVGLSHKRSAKVEVAQ
jgi:hypothetical protein